MQVENNKAARTNEAKREETRRQIAVEMERAHAAAINVAVLQQSQWWQDRKALLVMYN